MKRIEYEIFGNDAEIVSLEGGGGEFLEIAFTNLTEGYLSVGSEAHRFTDGKVTLNINRLPEGELSLSVTANGAIIRLPALFKSGHALQTRSASDEYIRELSIRERRLEKSLRMLEARADALEKSVFSTKIF